VIRWLARGLHSQCSLKQGETSNNRFNEVPFLTAGDRQTLHISPSIWTSLSSIESLPSWWNASHSTKSETHYQQQFHVIMHIEGSLNLQWMKSVRGTICIPSISLIDARGCWNLSSYRIESPAAECVSVLRSRSLRCVASHSGELLSPFFGKSRCVYVMHVVYVLL